MEEKAGRGLFAGMAPMACKNIDTVPITGFGAADIVGAINQDDRIILQIKRPQEFGWRPCSVAVGAQAIQPGATGQCFDAKFLRVAINTDDGVPKSGEVWGPVKESCLIRKHVPGGRILRDADASDGSNIVAPSGTVLLMRYEPIDIWGKLQADLMPGESAEVTLMRYNKLRSGTAKLVDVDITVTVYEATGTLSEVVPSGMVFFRWDEGSGRYHLRGWVC